ncbi:MAG: type IV toxin-antitoxin system AbiEi family antitoxin domain-containing protein [Akkermansia sp.]
MTKRELAEQVLESSRGIAKTVDFLSSGLSKTNVALLCQEGLLERIRHGYYQLSGNASISEELLLATLIPEGIVCMESALFYYGYSDFTPRIWTIAVPRTISRVKLKTEAVRFRAYYIPKAYYEIGRTTEKLNGVQLPIYDRERTICDCFKYRTKLDHETFNKAIYAYIADDKKNLSNLAKYAKEMRLFKKLNALMEVMLNA